jgi:hypothetical protein
MFFAKVETQIKWYRQPLRLAMLTVLMLSVMALFVKPSKATIGAITKADLFGNWQGTLVGFTGCGNSSELFNISMNAAGAGTGTLQTHGNCGDSSLTGQSFTILSLNANGTGTAGLSCGPGCGWLLAIQVSPDRSSMNLADVTDPGNYLVGTAVHQ